TLIQSSYCISVSRSRAVKTPTTITIATDRSDRNTYDAVGGRCSICDVTTIVSPVNTVVRGRSPSTSATAGAATVRTPMVIAWTRRAWSRVSMNVSVWNAASGGTSTNVPKIGHVDATATALATTISSAGRPSRGGRR